MDVLCDHVSFLRAGSSPSWLFIQAAGRAQFLESTDQKRSGEWLVFGHVPFFLWDIRVHAEITPNSRSLGSPKLHNSIGAPSLLILTTLFGKIQQARPPAGPLTASSTSQMLQAGDLWAGRKQSLAARGEVCKVQSPLWKGGLPLPPLPWHWVGALTAIVVRLALFS